MLRITMKFQPFRLLTLLVAGLVPSDNVGAQVRARQPNPVLRALQANEKPLINDLQVDMAAPVASESRIESLAREVKFMAKVGELTAEEAEALSTAGQRLTMNRALGALGGVQIANDRPLAASECTGSMMRRNLTPLLKQVSFRAWEKFDAERERLEARQKRAAMLSMVAEIDEAVWLSGEQRRELCELLTAHSDDWWRSNLAKSVLLPNVQTGQWMIASGNLGGFKVVGSELSQILRPSQLARYDELERPVADGLQQIVRQARVMAPAAVPVAPPPPPPQGMAPPAARAAAPAAGFAQMGFAQAAQAAPAGVARQGRVVRLGPTFEEQTKRLNEQLSHLTEHIELTCELSDRQREKLLLAGKLDVQRLLEPAEQPPDEQQELVAIVKLSALLSQWPPQIFTTEHSAYQKALRKQLSDDQKQRLTDAERARREFQQQVLIAAVVVGFARSAALTSAQCDSLVPALRDALPEMPDGAATNWRAQCLRVIAELPEEKFRPPFLDFQWPAAKRQLAKLAAAAQQLEEQANQPVAGMLDGGVLIVE
jgi:hypothetical protein